MEKSVVVFSGGLDSTTLLHYVTKELEHEVFPISVDYGQKHNIELGMARLQIKQLRDYNELDNVRDLKIVDMNFMKKLLGNSSALTSNSVDVPDLEEVIGEPQPITYVPFRNLIFLSIALSYAEAVEATNVFYGAQKHDEYSGYWDTTTYFVDKVNDVAGLNRKNQIRIRAPFVNLHKSEEVVLGKYYGVDYSRTHTCYRGDNCTDCPTCRDRIKAFCEAGFRDPLSYKKKVTWKQLIEKHKKEFDVDDIKKRIVV